MQPESRDTYNLQNGLRQFSLGEMLAATNDFSDAFAVGEGGFAKVYKGQIDDGSHTVAIKKSTSMSAQLRKDFRDEILMVSKFRHSHLVSLIGYCETDNEMILVYEYMAGGNLHDRLHKLSKYGKQRIPLCWVDRLKICIGAAQGLDYLHTGTGINRKVIHRDIKSSNILLDQNQTTAKIADFGLSKIGPSNQPNTCVMTRVMGTFGYLDPDYSTTGSLTSKSDVYAFGVVLFELLSGRPAVDSKLDYSQRGLAGWARVCVKHRRVNSIVDPNLKSEILPRSLSAYVAVANRCLNVCPKERPTMKEVLAKLVLSKSLQEAGKQIGKNLFDVADKFKSLFSVTPKPKLSGLEISGLTGNSADVEATEANVEDVVVTSVELDILKKITNNFSKNSLIGRSGLYGSPSSGPIYFGILKSGQGSSITCIPLFNQSEFFLEKVNLLSMLKHNNVVKLLHYYYPNDNNNIMQRCYLVHEYAPNGPLHRNLYDSQPSRVLSWSERVGIAIGAAKGLEYLHEKEIIHRAVMSSSVFLFGDGNAKIGNIQLLLRDLPMCSMRGVLVYRMFTSFFAPEQVISGKYSSQSDVYGFGVVLLELLTGKRPNEFSHWNLASKKPSQVYIKEIVDPRLNGEYPPLQAKKIVEIAISCIKNEPALRPSISSVLKELEEMQKEVYIDLAHS